MRVHAHDHQASKSGKLCMRQPQTTPGNQSFEAIQRVTQKHGPSTGLGPETCIYN